MQHTYKVFVIGPPSNPRDAKSPARFTRVETVRAVDRRAAAIAAANK